MLYLSSNQNKNVSSELVPFSHVLSVWGDPILPRKTHEWWCLGMSKLLLLTSQAYVGTLTCLNSEALTLCTRADIITDLKIQFSSMHFLSRNRAKESFFLKLVHLREFLFFSS